MKREKCGLGFGCSPASDLNGCTSATAAEAFCHVKSGYAIAQVHAQKRVFCCPAASPCVSWRPIPHPSTYNICGDISGAKRWSKEGVLVLRRPVGGKLSAHSPLRL